MPQRPQRPCRHCKALHRNASGYCNEHVGLAKQWRKTPGKSGRGGRPWRRLRDYILARDGYLCQCRDCQKRLVPLVATEVDHIIPESQGGTDDHSNLRAINEDCHRKKTQAEARAGRGLKRRGG
ncbi:MULTISPECIES: HNH endonuclease [unclassified Pusillimonas]|uniref:HNH endonuclease n=1 Tax=unclassified Pusillimonas TaxID=2640016 RepID=UPI000B9CC557|nr:MULTISPECIES: HNH endonuclease [unclassified Pusillimonas]OXR49599.1 HNH endonuclease [Pusillimonas sp. T2]ROT44384.1 HNH endonuclease [Pusillimonas sp. NJUB218]